MIPNVPSLPMNNYFRSGPVLSFLTLLFRLSSDPSALITSNPTTYPHNRLFLTIYDPAAYVDILPPIIQLPLEPRSYGHSNPYYDRWSFRS